MSSLVTQPLLSIMSHDQSPAPKIFCSVLTLLFHEIINGPVPPETTASIDVN